MVTFLDTGPPSFCQMISGQGEAYQEEAQLKKEKKKKRKKSKQQQQNGNNTVYTYTTYTCMYVYTLSFELSNFTAIHFKMILAKVKICPW